MKKKYEIEIRWTAFPLRPDIPEEGFSLKELFAGRLSDMEKITARLKRAAIEESLPFVTRERIYNSRLAQELGKWAQSMGRGDQLYDALFQACFGEDRDIGKISELATLAESVGLSSEEAQEVLETRFFKKAIDSDWSRSNSEGITMIPTIVMNSRKLVGARPYQAMEEFIKINGAKKRDIGI